MTDLFAWSLDLGYWRGVRVRIHLLLVIFALLSPLLALLTPEHAVIRALCIEGLFLVSLAIHELGHALASYLSGSEPEDVLLGPWGNIVAPPACFRPQETPWIPLGGILASGAVALFIAIGLSMNGVLMVFTPFGNLLDAGAPHVFAKGEATMALPLTRFWVIGWFGWLNWVLFLLNLIPALPLDGGRVVRSIVARSSLHPRDSLIVPIMARACAALLGVIGLFRLFGGRIDNFLTLALIAVIIEMTVRLESRIFEEGGDYETGAFGYDFSQGYTSLEGSSPKVRPYRESAIKRWRRKRSEHRRQRRQIQEAAEERRLDEILDKLHRLGKAALSEEENKFLVRVSSKIRGKSKA